MQDNNVAKSGLHKSVEIFLYAIFCVCRKIQSEFRLDYPSPSALICNFRSPMQSRIGSARVVYQRVIIQSLHYGIFLHERD